MSKRPLLAALVVIIAAGTLAATGSAASCSNAGFKQAVGAAIHDYGLYVSNHNTGSYATASAYAGNGAKKLRNAPKPCGRLALEARYYMMNGLESFMTADFPFTGKAAMSLAMRDNWFKQGIKFWDQARADLVQLSDA